MKLPIVYRAVPQSEFDAATIWYAARGAKLGADFVAEVQRVIGQIGKHPKRYPIIERDIREAPVRRFPYCVYYRVKLDRVVVLAVFHTSRDPGVWQARA